MSLKYEKDINCGCNPSLAYQACILYSSTEILYDIFNVSLVSLEQLSHKSRLNVGPNVMQEIIIAIVTFSA